ncbi:MAG: hypothetical protein WKF78_13420 [Candidatus Limnocylindrales bacterium]
MSARPVSAAIRQAVRQADGDWTDPTVARGRQVSMSRRPERRPTSTAASRLPWVAASLDAIAQVVQCRRPEAADMYYEGGFVGGIATGQANKDRQAGETDADWFDFPAIQRQRGRHDLRRRRHRSAHRPIPASRNSWST